MGHHHHQLLVFSVVFQGFIFRLDSILSRMTAPVSSLIEEDTLSKASEILVYDADGKAVKFGELYSAKETIVVFIR